MLPRPLLLQTTDLEQEVARVQQELQQLERQREKAQRDIVAADEEVRQHRLAMRDIKQKQVRQGGCWDVWLGSGRWTNASWRTKCMPVCAPHSPGLSFLSSCPCPACSGRRSSR